MDDLFFSGQWFFDDCQFSINSTSLKLFYHMYENSLIRLLLEIVTSVASLTLLSVSYVCAQQERNTDIDNPAAEY